MASIHSLLQTPGCSSETTHAAPGPEAGAAINQSTIGGSDTSSVNPPEASTAINHPSKHQSFITPPFARYLVVKHQDKDKNILKINPYAMQKALEGLIGDKFVCTRYEKSKSHLQRPCKHRYGNTVKPAEATTWPRRPTGHDDHLKERREFFPIFFNCPRRPPDQRDHDHPFPGPPEAVT